jgi:hypothetical protein
MEAMAAVAEAVRVHHPELLAASDASVDDTASDFHLSAAFFALTFSPLSGLRFAWASSSSVATLSAALLDALAAAYWPSGESAVGRGRGAEAAPPLQRYLAALLPGAVARVRPVVVQKHAHTMDTPMMTPYRCATLYCHRRSR